MKDVLEALERGESVTVLHRGKVKGTLTPTCRAAMKVEEHPFFGSSGDETPVKEVVARLRAPRHRAV